jgi:hypothetical protein
VANQTTEAAEQRRITEGESPSLLRSSGLLLTSDLRFYRRLPHAAAPQRVAVRPPFNGYTLSGQEDGFAVDDTAALAYAAGIARRISAVSAIQP